MNKRFISVWFPHLKTDWFTRRDPRLRSAPFVLSLKDHNRVIVSAVNPEAEKQGINTGITVADARALFPNIKVFDDDETASARLLTAFAEYCIRFTPVAAIDLPDSIILDVSGCAHLWGGEYPYITAITDRFKKFGYDVKACIAGTIGAAWAMTHFGDAMITEKDQHESALSALPVASLRLEHETLELLHNLGLRRIRDIMNIPLPALLRRFGTHLIQRLRQASGYEEEIITPVEIPEIYRERLPCPELIVTATAIEIALDRLLKILCQRLQNDEKGLRSASFKCYRVDGKVETIEIGTNHPSHNCDHLFKLFQLKTDTIEPALGIELFTLEASKIEDLQPVQEKLWAGNCGLENIKFSELLDRVANKIGANNIHRYLPDEHYWPERSIKPASLLSESATTSWRSDKPRPIQILSTPEPVQVTAPIPDYPPMLFRYKNKLHTIKKADGPERIESEWWLEEGLHRDYYTVEDEDGNRYWLFRSGHYTNNDKPQWFIHGFFA